ATAGARTAAGAGAARTRPSTAGAAVGSTRPARTTRAAGSAGPTRAAGTTRATAVRRAARASSQATGARRTTRLVHGARRRLTASAAARARYAARSGRGTAATGAVVTAITKATRGREADYDRGNGNEALVVHVSVLPSVECAVGGAGRVSPAPEPESATRLGATWRKRCRRGPRPVLERNDGAEYMSLFAVRNARRDGICLSFVEAPPSESAKFGHVRPVSDG